MNTGIVDDLVVIIALYTSSSITNNILTITPSTASWAYKTITWWQKLAVIRKGVVTNILPIDTYFDWYYAYRQVNFIEYGTASSLTPVKFQYRYDSVPTISPQFQRKDQISNIAAVIS